MSALTIRADEVRPGDILELTYCAGRPAVRVASTATAMRHGNYDYARPVTVIRYAEHPHPWGMGNAYGPADLVTVWRT